LVQLISQVNVDVLGRYQLTTAGPDLLPILQAIAAWGKRICLIRWRVPDWFWNATPDDFLTRP